jgi:gliding motility-associated-like protein
MSYNASCQIFVDTGFTANQLAKMLVGQGVTVFNASLKGKANQYAKFSVDKTALPIDSGVVLTTGRAKTIGSIIGVNGSQSLFASNAIGTSGDVSLNNIFGISNTKDACVLEFDFIPQGDSINVNYIFSSEEYDGFACSNVNDAFAFIISGLGFATPTNIALVPGTNIPISVNSVNGGLNCSGPGCDITNCTSLGQGSPFRGYYVNNLGGNYLTHYGRTVTLQASAAVQRCTLYHIKLVIADVGDDLFDSAVFLQAGSFSSPVSASLQLVNTYADNTNDVLVERCYPNGKIQLVRNATANNALPMQVKLKYTGTATYGIDYNNADTLINFLPFQDTAWLPINVIDDGLGDDNETIVIKLVNGCTSFSDSTVILIKEKWTYTSTQQSSICSYASKNIKSSYSDSVTNSFTWNTGNNSNNITVNTSGTYWVNAVFKNSCTQSDTFKIAVDNFSIKTSNDSLLCRNDSTFVTYTANQPTTTRLWNTGSIDSIIVAKSIGSYQLTATNYLGCIAKDTTIISPKASPKIALPNAVGFCKGDSILLDATTLAGTKYLWSNGDSTNKIWATTQGLFKVTANLNGCIDTGSTAVTVFELPTINAGPDKVVINNLQITFDATASSNAIRYTWQPNFNLSSATVLKPMVLGTKNIIYTVTAYTSNNCQASDSVYLKIIDGLQIPNVFSPNKDGVNDTWNIIGIGSYPKVLVQIFDRWGSLVFNSIGYTTPWDGNKNNKPLPVGVYYYIIKTNQPSFEKTVAGNISLLR